MDEQEQQDLTVNRQAESPENPGTEKRQDEFDGLSIEDAFEQIRDLLVEMEKEDVTLEKSFEDYEKGMRLIRYCNGKIDRVEKKVQKLNEDGSLSDFE